MGAWPGDPTHVLLAWVKEDESWPLDAAAMEEVLRNASVIKTRLIMCS